MVMMTHEAVAEAREQIDRDKARRRAVAGGTADGQYMLMVRLLLGCYVPDIDDADFATVRRAVSQ